MEVAEQAEHIDLSIAVVLQGTQQVIERYIQRFNALSLVRALGLAWRPRRCANACAEVVGLFWIVIQEAECNCVRNNDGQSRRKFSWRRKAFA